MFTEPELQAVLKQVKNASQKLYGDKLNRIILYGSYARGSQTEESDIDIMIILNCDVNEIRELRSKTAEMSSEISLEQGVFLSVLLRDKKHFDENAEFLPFYRNIVKEGIEIYE